MSNLPFIRNDGTGQRAILESIAAKQALKPKVDNQGRVIGEPIQQTYDTNGVLIPKAAPTDDDAA